MHGMNQGSLLRGRGRSIAYMLYKIHVYAIYILQVNLFIIFMHLVEVIDYVLF